MKESIVRSGAQSLSGGRTDARGHGSLFFLSSSHCYSIGRWLGERQIYCYNLNYNDLLCYSAYDTLMIMDRNEAAHIKINPTIYNDIQKSTS